jgi:hypothetical protein
MKPSDAKLSAVEPLSPGPPGGPVDRYVVDDGWGEVAEVSHDFIPWFVK